MSWSCVSGNATFCESYDGFGTTALRYALFNFGTKDTTCFFLKYVSDQFIHHSNFAYSHLTSCRLSSHPSGDNVDVDVDVDVDGTSLVMFSPLGNLCLHFWSGCIEAAHIGSRHTLRVAPFNSTVWL